VSALRAVIEGNRAAQFPAIETTEFVWDGHCLCLELRPDGQETLHVHERNTLVPVLQIQGGAVYTVVCDHLGMPKELVDTSGTVAWAAAHNAWGEVLHEQRDAGATDVRSPFRLLGQYADEETGLCYSRYRYFDPATARFLSPDPIGLRGGLNLFAFPGAPTTDTDIFGLSGYKGARKTEGETFVSWKDGDDPRFFFTAELDDDGTLKFNARTRMVDDDGNEIAKSENLSGGKLFDESVEHFGDRVKGIEGKWHFGDNLDKFNEQVGQGVPDETAAQNTWTGGKAGDHGFTQVKVKDKSPDKPGEHEKVEVLFTKPEGSE
jgi:RHS repeat-associated protein